MSWWAVLHQWHDTEGDYHFSLSAEEIGEGLRPIEADGDSVLSGPFETGTETEAWLKEHTAYGKVRPRFSLPYHNDYVQMRDLDPDDI